MGVPQPYSHVSPTSVASSVYVLDYMAALKLGWPLSFSVTDSQMCFNYLSNLLAHEHQQLLL